VKDFFIRLRLFVSLKHKEPYLQYYKMLGFVPHRIEFYRTALTHRSAAVKSPTGDFVNNERLEYLGDSVLSAITSDILYHHFRKGNEGFLSGTRSKMVSRESLNRIARDIKLDKLTRTAKNNYALKNNIYGNAFEALIGAVYLDKGYDCCKKFIQHIFDQYLDLDKIVKKDFNYKSKLLEMAQHYKITLEYNSTDGKRVGRQEMFFQTEVLLNGVAVSSGTGCSKKESQQNAAQAALRKLKNREFLEGLMKKMNDKIIPAVKTDVT
jgi:ribonuclease-3